MLCPSCGTNVGTEARLCRGCSGGPASPLAGINGAESGLANAMTSSILGVAIMLSILVFSFGYVLHIVFERVLVVDGVLVAVTCALLIASIMGPSFINGSKIAVHSRLIHLLVAMLFLYTALELCHRPVVEYALARSKTSLETDHSVKKFEQRKDWWSAVKETLNRESEKENYIRER